MEMYAHQKIILARDFNYVENVEDRFPKLNKDDKKLEKKIKPQNLNTIDPLHKIIHSYTIILV